MLTVERSLVELPSTQRLGCGAYRIARDLAIGIQVVAGHAPEQAILRIAAQIPVARDALKREHPARGLNVKRHGRLAARRERSSDRRYRPSLRRPRFPRTSDCPGQCLADA